MNQQASYALYLDPTKGDALWQEWPQQPPTLAYYRLVDLAPEALQKFDPHDYPLADNTTVEIHPQQWDLLPFACDRLSIVLEKSNFATLTDIKARVQSVETDITFSWDHRFSVNYYIKLINYWIYCGVKHFSFYGLVDFEAWQRLQHFLNGQNFFFYDRYHACIKGHESRYQKHIAAFGNLLALGGWSRWTDEEGRSYTRGPKEKAWTQLGKADQKTEQFLFALADRDGLGLDRIDAAHAARAVKAGLAQVRPPSLIPTDMGLWDTVGLVSQLQQ